MMVVGNLGEQAGTSTAIYLAAFDEAVQLFKEAWTTVPTSGRKSPHIGPQQEAAGR